MSEGKAKRRRRWKWGVGVILSLAVIGFGIEKIDQLPVAFTRNTGTLAAYELAGAPVQLPATIRGASGLAYSPTLNSIFLLTNRPAFLHELDLTGKLLRSIELRGFEDTEGICWIGEDRFAVCEERKGTLVQFSLPRTLAVVERSLCQSTIVLAEPAGNRGLEGLAYDPGRRQFLAAKEAWPREIHAFLACQSPSPEEPSDWPIGGNSWLMLRRLSDLHFDPIKGRLFLLSRHSQCIAEMERGGRIVGRFALKARSAGLSHALWRAEGMTFDAKGTLYVCEEPNTFYIFHPKAQ